MMKKVEEKARMLGNDMEAVKKELKKVQSVKCRLAKQKGRSDYEQAMKEVLAEEQLLKEVRRLLDPKERAVTEFEQEDVDRLDYDQTVKALKSIQSKKTLSRWLTDVEGDNDEYRSAVRIEQMLKEHREKVKPVDEAYIRKSELQAVIEAIEAAGEVSTERMLEMMKELL